jgi:hypothetical protein
MDWIEMLAGIAIFIYGLQLANDGSQKRAGIWYLTRHGGDAKLAR